MCGREMDSGHPTSILTVPTGTSAAGAEGKQSPPTMFFANSAAVDREGR